MYKRGESDPNASYEIAYRLQDIIDDLHDVKDKYIDSEDKNYINNIEDVIDELRQDKEYISQYSKEIAGEIDMVIYRLYNIAKNPNAANVENFEKMFNRTIDFFTEEKRKRNKFYNNFD